jgi:hypothetical protein
MNVRSVEKGNKNTRLEMAALKSTRRVSATG